MHSHSPVENKIPTIVYYVVLAAVIALVVVVRIRLLSVPLERDEGEFAYLGQLMLKGVPPYLQAYSMKPPGTFAMYAVSMLLFGQTAMGIHLGLLLVNVCTVLVVYLLARRLFEIPAACFSAVCFALLSVSSSVQGVFAHATHFVNLFVLTGALFLLRGQSTGKGRDYYIAGLALGTSLMMKQPALFFILGFAVYILLAGLTGPKSSVRETSRALFMMLAGIVTVTGLVVLALAATGVLHQFWFWTYLYPRELVHSMSIYAGIARFISSSWQVTVMNLPLFLIAMLGFVLALRNADRDKAWFLICSMLAGFLAISPGFYFSKHYFVVLLPTVALCAGYAIAAAAQFIPSGPSWIRISLPMVLIMTVTAYSTVIDRDYLFKLNPFQVSRTLYSLNPFPESLPIADYLKRNSLPSAYIAVIGSEPQIAFYADRRLASRFSQVYPLMENHPYAESMQQQMISDIEVNKPEFVVMANITSSFSVLPTSSSTLINWSREYLSKFYEQVGVVDIFNHNDTSYRWDGHAKGYSPASPFNVVIYRRVI